MARRLPLLVAVAALLLTALLMWRADGAPRVQSAPAPQFPRYMQHDDWERARARRTLALPGPAAVAAPAAAHHPSEPPQARDPFLAALPPAEDQPLIVLEANALRHSRLGELFIRCVLQRDGQDRLAEFARETGVDPLKDVDRVAFSREGIVVSGFFDRARLDRLEPDARVLARGERGRVYRFERAGGAAPDHGATPGTAFGLWGDQLVAFGSPEFVEGALDRVEGRAPAPAAQFPEELTYGEAYGVVPGAALEPLLRSAQGSLAERIAALASRIELHADAMSDVALVARVSGSDAAGLDDLARSIGAAMAVGRLQAKASGSAALAELLEHARVQRGGGEFSVELAVPADALERWFTDCD